MLNWLYSWFQSPGQRRIAELREQVEIRAREAELGILGSLVDPREPILDDLSFLGGTVIGDVNAPWLDNRERGEAIPVYQNEGQLKILRDRSRVLCSLNEFAICGLSNRQGYICGTGFGHKLARKLQPGERPPEGPDRLVMEGQEFIDDFVSRNKLGERQQETVFRGDEDGEGILRIFHVGDGLSEIRFVEPEHLRGYDCPDPAGAFGILTEPDDVEKVLAYYIAEEPQATLQTTEVDACDVFHFKMNARSSWKRGLPTFHPVRKNLQRAESLLKAMSTLANVQAKFALIRKHKQYGKSAIDAFRQGQQSGTYQRPFDGQTQPYQQLLDGLIVDTNEFTDYDFPAARVDASGLVGVLQAELRAVAARLIMPEWMLTVDASNNNFASSLIAEAPSTRNFERLQKYYGDRWGEGPKCHSVLWRALEIAVSWGRLPREILTDCVLQAEPPPLTVRNKPQETNRAKTLSEAGILSDATWSKWEGLDHAQEQALGAKKQQGGGGMPGMGGGGAGPGPEVGPPSPPGSSLLGTPEGYTWEELLEAEQSSGERKVGDVWKGPSGKWFTKNQQGRVVPAKDPNQAPKSPEEQKAERQKKREEEYQRQISKPAEVRKMGQHDAAQRAAMEATVKDMFGEGDFAPAMVGAQPGSEITVWGSEWNGRRMLSIGVDHPAIKDQSRTLTLTPQGELICSNNLFFLKKKFRGGGLGMKVFSDQVKALAEAGADRIETCAGKGGIMNGYYTWPTLGYNAPLEAGWVERLGGKGALRRTVLSMSREDVRKGKLSPEEAKAKAESGGYNDEAKRCLAAVQAAGPKDVLGVMATPEGKKVWAAMGYMASMSFDLRAGSRSLQVLNAYLASKGKPPIEPPAEAEKLRQDRKARAQQRQEQEKARKEAALKAFHGASRDELTAFGQSVYDAAEGMNVSLNDMSDQVTRAREAHPGIDDASALRRAAYSFLDHEARNAGRDPAKVADLAERSRNARQAAGVNPDAISPAQTYRECVQWYDSRLAALDSWEANQAQYTRAQP